MRGKYIVIEGSDGTGKSTQIDLLKKFLNKKGVVSKTIHEPGETAIGIELRKIIKNKNLPRSARTNLLLFTAARCELAPIIENHLNKGEWVISSRNWLSTVVYQGYGEGIDINEIKQITALFTNKSYLQTDLTLVLYANTDTLRSRIINRDNKSSSDTFESKPDNFQCKLNKGYQKIIADFNLPAINTNDKTIDEVHNEIIKHISNVLN